MSSSRQLTTKPQVLPFVEVETESNSSRELKINLPGEVIIGDTINIEVTAADNPIEGITVKVNTTSLARQMQMELSSTQLKKKEPSRSPQRKMGILQQTRT